MNDCEFKNNKEHAYYALCGGHYFAFKKSANTDISGSRWSGQSGRPARSTTLRPLGQAETPAVPRIQSSQHQI
jgi:hypothetical protein